MNGVKVLASALIVAGVLGLVYSSFSYTKSTHEAKLGPIELSVKDKQTVNVPVWADVGGIVVGGAVASPFYRAEALGEGRSSLQSRVAGQSIPPRRASLAKANEGDLTHGFYFLNY